MPFSDTFSALSDPIRREILTILRSGRRSAGEIAAHFADRMTAATVSYHLAKLRRAGLIFEERQKNYIYYTLNTSVIEEMMVWLARLGESPSAQSEEVQS
ncbi:MAG: winged helix-turn-helix transcriptional regulator [Clostridia bacterium]|nr:winged helix-turn-helix transcriptional regulator [Clostridia bacterium]